MENNNNDIDLLRNYIDAVSKNSLNGLENPKEIDLVISGGAFNGGYGYGALLYLRSLEKQNKIKINRVSGCSTGSLLAIVYLSSKLLNLEELYLGLQRCLRDKGTLHVLREIIEKLVDNALEEEGFLEKISGRLFVTRTNLSSGAHEVVEQFNDRDELVDALFSSCFLPFIVDGNMRYKEKYVDGIVPFLFTDAQRPSLYIDLLCFSKIHKMMITMKEVNPHGRIIDGANDASKFFNEGISGICSWVNRWGFTQIAVFRITHLIFYIIVAILDILSHGSIPDFISGSPLYKGTINTLTRLLRDMLCKLSSHDA